METLGASSDLGAKALADAADEVSREDEEEEAEEEGEVC
jgi:hypothetical protein